MINHNAIYAICENALNNPYEYGNNDCNTLALSILDEIAGTEWVKECTYTTYKGGLKRLIELEYDSTGDIIKQYAEPVTVAIDGDIWIDPDNGNMLSVVMSNRMLTVNNEHTKFNLSPMEKGTYYRIRKLENGKD